METLVEQNMDGNITLLELKSRCLAHQEQNKDCETCSLYKFCNYELTTSYPSGWRLDNVSSLEEPNILHMKDSNDIVVFCNIGLGSMMCHYFTPTRKT